MVNEIQSTLMSIVRTSAGVCIALAAKDAIQSLVSDIIIPIIAAVFTSTKIEFYAPQTKILEG